MRLVERVSEPETFALAMCVQPEARIMSMSRLPPDFQDRLASHLLDDPIPEAEDWSSNPHRYSFELCRRVQGTLYDAGISPLRCDPILLLPEIESVIDGGVPEALETESVLETVVHVWGRICCPSGFDPVEYAAHRARQSSQHAPGVYVRGRQLETASLIWRTLCCLPEIDGAVFLTMRTAAEIAGVDKDTAQRAIGALIRNGVIGLVQKGRVGRANRYQVLRRPVGDIGF